MEGSPGGDDNRPAAWEEGELRGSCHETLEEIALKGGPLFGSLQVRKTPYSLPSLSPQPP